MKVTVHVTRSAEGYFKAWCPALPGCAVIATTRGEAEAQIVQAIEGYVASLDVALPRELDRLMHHDAEMCVA